MKTTNRTHTQQYQTQHEEANKYSSTTSNIKIIKHTTHTTTHKTIRRACKTKWRNTTTIAHQKTHKQQKGQFQQRNNTHNYKIKKHNTQKQWRTATTHNKPSMNNLKTKKAEAHHWADPEAKNNNIQTSITQKNKKNTHTHNSKPTQWHIKRQKEHTQNINQQQRKNTTKKEHIM